MSDSSQRDNPSHSTLLCPLQLGATGPDVTQLQALLTHHGFNPGPIDGQFGTRTHSSLHRFQLAQGLDLMDSVDLVTWQALSAV
jgi:peptidoglycan hydrolase-like protein with peptidoglycan-binding domain